MQLNERQRLDPDVAMMEAAQGAPARFSGRVGHERRLVFETGGRQIRERSERNKFWTPHFFALGGHASVH